MTTDASKTRASAFYALGPVFFYFFVAGIATVMLGPLLPALIGRWHIQDAQAGTLFTTTFAGQLCGAWFATRNLRASILYGACMSAAGCAFMGWADFNTAHVALFCVGLGLGAGLTAGNVISGIAIPSARTRLIALLNMTWGMGAISCSLLVRACGAGRVRLFFCVLASCLVLAAAFSIVLPRDKKAEPAVTGDEDAKTKSRMPMPLWPLLMFSAAMLLFVGIENALGGWLPSYGVRTSSALLASSIALYFWVAEMTGRLLLAVLTDLFGEASLYRGSVALLIVSEGVLIMAKHLSAGGVVALTIFCGLAIAPIYPLILSFFLARTGNHPRLGRVFAAASVGGATLPWLTGVVSTEFHGLRAGLAVPAVGTVLLLLLASVITSTPMFSARATER
ncbi:MULTISPECIES: sugar MFS transporter [Acidobacteriaceae]|uniref:MFS transporter n=1 Tax=Acidobacteriaceae TaxID=204434 RepID=UPI00131C6647|nr:MULTISPECIES: MFS transporter [Acidobacteriaceae]MDW5264357.1 MFS transporter [Edaphobacter sp.]